eukprot:TRINITY_DN7965_c0_g1_i1.p2 TRINITY_DN7965_c0_g1~~TRINITY_DN7965_c0_g1_i1.p2  ORF type:complete len:214 (-),score=41.02 TRINITY_DN7965_c0_g1_i1:41-595(-)
MLFAVLALASAATAAPIVNRNVCANALFRGSVQFSSIYKMDWCIDDALIEFTLTISRDCWIGMGISPDNFGMVNADIMYASQTGGALAMVDSFSFGEGTPNTDTSIGGTNDILSYTGAFGPTTTVTFSRLLDTGDVIADYPIVANATVPVIWAHGNANARTIGYHGGAQRGTVIVAFTSEEYRV